MSFTGISRNLAILLAVMPPPMLLQPTFSLHQLWRELCKNLFLRRLLPNFCQLAELDLAFYSVKSLSDIPSRKLSAHSQIGWPRQTAELFSICTGLSFQHKKFSTTSIDELVCIESNRDVFLFHNTDGVGTFC